jgi:hypothetical protein
MADGNASRQSLVRICAEGVNFGACGDLWPAASRSCSADRNEEIRSNVVDESQAAIFNPSLNFTCAARHPSRQRTSGRGVYFLC